MSGTETRLHVRLIAAADSALVPDIAGMVKWSLFDLLVTTYHMAYTYRWLGCLPFGAQ